MAVTAAEATALASSRLTGELLMALGKCWAIRKEIAEQLVAGGWGLGMARTLESVDATATVAKKEDPKPRVMGNGVSVVPIHGMITPTLTFMAWLMGADYGLDDVMGMVHAAAADPDTKSVVLDIDSPGGVVDGIPEAAARIRQLRDDSGKPFVAVANGQMASAAYWLGSQAHEIVVAPSGSVGSVGVYQRHEDVSQMTENEGVKVSLISAGRYKTETSPYEPLSGEARAAMQADVNYFYGMFTADVATGRGVPLNKAEVSEGSVFGGGRTYPAKPAVSMELADREATLSETISRLSSGRAKIRRMAAEDDASIEVDRPGTTEMSSEDKERFGHVLTALAAND